MGRPVTCVRRLFREILNGTDLDAAANLRTKLAEEASKPVIAGTPGEEERNFIQSITKATNRFLEIRDKKGNLVAWVDISDSGQPGMIHIMDVDENGQLKNVMGPQQELSLVEVAKRIKAWTRLIDAFNKGKVSVTINPIKVGYEKYIVGIGMFVGEDKNGIPMFSGFFAYMYTINGGPVNTCIYAYKNWIYSSKNAMDFYADDKNINRWYIPLFFTDPIHHIHQVFI